MSIILNIETSSKNCSVSISKNGKTVGLEEQYFEKYSHSKSLHVFIDNLFKKTKLSPADLSAVAISEGPGSYTGLRIGASAAKGMCFALDIPLISLDTMHIYLEELSVVKDILFQLWMLEETRSTIRYLNLIIVKSLN